MPYSWVGFVAGDVSIHLLALDGTRLRLAAHFPERYNTDDVVLMPCSTKIFSVVVQRHTNNPLDAQLYRCFDNRLLWQAAHVLLGRTGSWVRGACVSLYCNINSIKSCLRMGDNDIPVEL